MMISAKVRYLMAIGNSGITFDIIEEIFKTIMTENL